MASKYLTPLSFEAPNGEEQTFWVGYTREGERVVRVIDLTQRFGLKHHVVLTRLGRDFSLTGIFTINPYGVRAVNLDGYRRVAEMVDHSRENRLLLAWCEQVLVPFLSGGDALPVVAGDRPDPSAPFDVFHFDGYMVRTITGPDGEPWWLAADACGVLELGHVGSALRRLDDDEKGVLSVPTLGGNQDKSIINESGLYSLIMTSRKPEAKRFKKWVTSEVLPALRKKGSYSIPGVLPAGYGSDDDPVAMALESAAMLRRRTNALEREQASLRQDFQSSRLQLTHQIGEANDRASKAEAKAAEADARVAEAEAKFKQAQAQISENEVRIAEANATAARSHAESLRASQEAARAIKTVTGESDLFCLVPWASKRGVHLVPPHDGLEGKVCKDLCVAAGRPMGVNRQSRWDVNTYPEDILYVWLEGYKARQRAKEGPKLFEGRA